MFDLLFLALIFFIKWIIYQQLKLVPGNYWLSALDYFGFTVIVFAVLVIIGGMLLYPLLMLSSSSHPSIDLFILFILSSVGIAFVLSDLVHYRATSWIKGYNSFFLILIVNLVVSSSVFAISYYGLNYFS